MKKYYSGINNLYLLAFIEGASVMIVELGSSRMIAPVYGTSFIVWSIVIGVSVFSMACGYLVGSSLAGKSNLQEILFNIFLACSILLFITPYFALRINDAPAEFSYWKVTEISFLIIFPVVFLLAATSPLIIQEISSFSVFPKKEPGKIFGISTLGGIAGTIISGFWAIPLIGIKNTCIFLSFIVILFPSAIFFKKSGIFKRLFFVFFCVVLLLVSLSGPSRKMNKIDLIYESEGIMGQVKVLDIPKKIDDPSSSYDRLMMVNRIGQTWIDKNTGTSVWSYINYITLIGSCLSNTSPRVLLLGYGGGTLAAQLEKMLNANVEAVEIDQRMIFVADHFFPRPQKAIIHIDDGRHFVNSCNNKYDLIILDVSKGEIAPAHLFSIEFLIQLKSHLNQNGLVIINFNGYINGEKGMAAQGVYNTLIAAHYFVKLIPTFEKEEDRNMIFVASLSNNSLQPRLKLNVNNSPLDLERAALKPVSIDFKTKIVYTDDKPVMEKLSFKAGYSWRIDYEKNFSAKFRQEGLKLFR